VTTQNIIAASPSTCSPNSKWKPLMAKKNSERSTVPWPFATWTRTSTEMTKDAAVARIPMGAPFPGVRLPKNTITKNAISGSDGMSHAHAMMPDVCTTMGSSCPTT